MSEQPEPNKLCPILMLCPPKTGTYGDIVCLQDKCAMWRGEYDKWIEINVSTNPSGYVAGIQKVKVNDGYCGLAVKP